MSEDIGLIYTTQIPEYEDGADIKAALKLYHYGQASEPATMGDVPAESIAGHLIDLQDQIDSLGNNAGIQASIVDAKGDLIVGSAADTVLRKAVGTNNQVLAADSAETTGVKWTAATDLISSASTSVAGKVQLEDSVSSTSTSKAATPNSVKTVNDSLSTSYSFTVTNEKFESEFKFKFVDTVDSIYRNLIDNIDQIKIKSNRTNLPSCYV